ncbi:hypothetical protein [Solicola gregarius]|uniref:Uncharacterized protein n=1 Tax=Solicola gregarius TaxID=2908642 RepID=A0AA46TIR3_9ACTN|nr:hypothetical protein [Solicola gregarius]UYM06046.1 hypothetical protein L0C25_02950 [Solicola gregarius]
MSYPPPGDPNQPQYPPNQPPQYPPNQPPQYQQPYGTPYPTGQESGYGYGGYAPHIERPGSVTAGAVIAIVLSGISALAALGSLVGVIAAWNSMIDEFRSDPGQYELTADQIDQIADAKAGVVVFVVIWAIIAAFGVVVAVLAIKGQNWARITLTVLAAISLVIGLILITSFISAIWVLGSIACIICLFVGGANDWYRYRRDQRRQGV